MQKLAQHDGLTVWRVVDEQQPHQPPVVQYHVHIDGAPAWLALLSQMPATHVYALSVAGGAVGAIAMCALAVLVSAIVAVVAQALALVAIVAVAAVVGLVTIAVMTKG